MTKPHRAAHGASTSFGWICYRVAPVHSCKPALAALERPAGLEIPFFTRLVVVWMNNGCSVRLRQSPRRQFEGFLMRRRCSRGQKKARQPASPGNKLHDSRLGLKHARQQRDELILTNTHYNTQACRRRLSLSL